MSCKQPPLFPGHEPPPTPEMEPCPTCDGSGEVEAGKLSRLLERPGITGSGQPATSRQAGTTPRKGSQRHHVLATLAEDGPLTALDVSRRIGRSPNQTATRLGELHDDLFVTYARDDMNGAIIERQTTPGNTGMVHELTPTGRRVLAELRERR